MSTKGLSKTDLIRNLTSIICNRDKDDPLDHICWQKDLTGSLSVYSKDVDSQKIRTNLDKKLWCTKTKQKRFRGIRHEICTTERASERLPGAVLEELRKMKDGCTQQILQEITTEISNVGDSVSAEPFGCVQLLLLKVNH